MIKRILGLGSSTPFHSPYRRGESNSAYNLLFCDDLKLFRKKANAPKAEPWNTVFSNRADVDTLGQIACNTGLDSRLRLLSYNLIRSKGYPVRKGQLLGVIVEIGLKRGLDVVAVYTDGRARYINKTGKLILFETAPTALTTKIQHLLKVSNTAIPHMTPLKQPRSRPPTYGNVRLSFLTTDGLYFGEAPLASMEVDGFGGPVIIAAIDVMRIMVEIALSECRH